jgi:hypothetical protein
MKAYKSGEKIYTSVTIYQLVCKDENIKGLYIGHTSVKIKGRLSKHKSTCQNTNDKGYNRPLYKHIRATGGWYNWKCVILETCSSINKEEALWKRENGLKKLRIILTCTDQLHHMKRKLNRKRRIWKLII